mgnify:CR=1 FL=1
MFGNKGKDNLSSEQIREVVGSVEDPVREKPLGELGFVGEIEDAKKRIHIVLKLPTPAWRGRSETEADIARALADAGDDRKVEIEVQSDVQRSRPQGSGQSMVPGAKNVILFASGKGGVGKSTVATNIAAALADMGAKVGLLDSDIYGPSIPTMLGTHDRPQVVGNRLIPVDRHGMKLMSIGFIVDPKQAMSWRGPMLNGALIQFMRDVEWGELDYLVLDLPPGTGDVQLTIAQNLKVSGAVLVSTPQDVALADVIRGKAMFDKVDVPTLGVVENMAYFICDGCSKKHYIFSAGGAGRVAKELKVPLLGEIPLETGTRESGDSGTPEVLGHPDSSASQAFREVAMHVATDLALTAEQSTVKAGVGLKIIQ